MVSELVRRLGGRLGDPGAARGAAGVGMRVLVVVLGAGVLVAVRELVSDAWLFAFR
jgi:hypothetical protein